MEQSKIFNYNKIMKDEKEIKQIAQKISNLEKQCQNNPEQQDMYMKKIEKIAESLSLEELLQIDIYILENKLL